MLSKGTFVVIQKETKDEPSSMLEMRDIGSGCILAQARNNAVLRDVDMTKSIPTERKQIPASEIEDLILANAVLKFSQSNSIAVATQGFFHNHFFRFLMIELSVLFG